MKIDFEELYIALNFPSRELRTKQEIINMTGMKRQQWYKYEKKGELPSRFIFRIAEYNRKIMQILPRDFFLYNSFVVRVNMIYHNVGIYPFSEKINHSITKTQYLIDSFVPCYELKDKIVEAFYGDMLIPVVEFSDGYKLVTTMDSDKNDKTAGYADKLIIRVEVQNPQKINTETTFNRMISHIYNMHNMGCFLKKRDISELRKRCETSKKHANVIMTRYDKNDGSFIVVDTRLR